MLSRRGSVTHVKYWGSTAETSGAHLRHVAGKSRRWWDDDGLYCNMANSVSPRHSHETFRLRSASPSARPPPPTTSHWRLRTLLIQTGWLQVFNEEVRRHQGSCGCVCMCGGVWVGSRRSNSAARCPLITCGDFCWGVGGGFFLLSDWFILRLCIWWAPEWWRLITNTWARSVEDPRRAGINYSLPCLWKSTDCYQLRGTFFFFFFPVLSFLLGIWRQSLTPNVCWCCWSGTKHKLQSKLPPLSFTHCPLMRRLFKLRLEFKPVASD